MNRDGTLHVEGWRGPHHTRRKSESNQAGGIMNRTSTNSFRGRLGLVAVAVVVLAGCLGLLGGASVALAQESRIDMTVLGFTEDAKRMLVKMDDNQVGLGLRLYDVETGMPVKPWKKFPLIQYERGNEVAMVKKAKRRYKIKDEGIEAMKTKDEKIAFFGVEKGENLVIAATDYKRLGKLMDVPLKRDPETKKIAQATLKSIFWTSDYNHMVLVVHQKIKGQFLFEKDYFHWFEYKPRKIHWVEPEKKEDEKKKEKEDDSWWPF